MKKLPVRKASFRPMIESLEERVMLDSYFWLGNVSPFWSDARNWRVLDGRVLKAAHDVPNADDDVNFTNAAVNRAPVVDISSRGFQDSLLDSRRNTGVESYQAA